MTVKLCPKNDFKLCFEAECSWWIGGRCCMVENTIVLNDIRRLIERIASNR